MNEKHERGAGCLSPPLALALGTRKNGCSASDDTYYMHPGDWPGIEEPTPSVTYSIAAIYNSGSAETFYAHFYETNEMFLEAFRSCTKEDEKLYALDWHHEAFWFYPYGSFENALSNEA